MSGGDWDPAFDVLHQVVDAFEAIREREQERPAWMDQSVQPPPPRDPLLPKLMQHRLPNGRMLTEPTTYEAHVGTYGAAAWHDHFGGWEIGPCACGTADV